MVALVGLRCVGKTSVGRALAEVLGRRFIDLDEALVEGAEVGGLEDPGGPTPEHAGELLGRLGEARFRVLESEALERSLADPEPCVLATGGGVVLDPRNRGWLRDSSWVVWLRAPLDELVRRMGSDSTPRPGLVPGARTPTEEFERVAMDRDPLYRSVADLELEVGDRSPGELAEAIHRVLPRPTRGHPRD